MHIGVNHVDQNHYGGLSNLKAAVNDAETMQAFAVKFGYERRHVLRNEEATSHAVLTTLGEWSKELNAGDILMLSYSGHGGQIDDPQFHTPDDNGPDETWCLYDRQLIDDELFDTFLQFRDGVRILVVSDSCHSGTVTKVLENDAVDDAIASALQKLEDSGMLRTKEMRDNKPYEQYYAAVYQPILNRLKQEAATRRRSQMGASVKLFAACQDNQKAYDGQQNGRFTAMLKQMIDTGKVNKSTSSESLLQLLKVQYQYPTPNLLDYGAIIPAFDRYFPFLVNITEPEIVTGYRNPPSNEAAPDSWEIPPAQDAPPAPVGNPLSVSIEFTEGNYSPAALFPLLSPGVAGMRFLGRNTIVVDFKKDSHANVWDVIHHILSKAESAGLTLEVEPSQTVPAPVTDREENAVRTATASFEYLEQWPPVSSGSSAPFGWHLGPEYSELAAARDHVMADLESGRITKRVRIAHFDTGYFPSHPAIWDNKLILRDLARSFVSGELNNKAIDIFYNDDQEGHGLGTLALLAGWKMPKEYTDNVSLGYLGGVPCAEVIPMRLDDGVVILDTQSFVDAVDYAIETGCEVITMSRGGKPSAKMAKAVNKAYEAGIVIVTAAGNSIVSGPGFAKFGPRTVVWPARFARVIAACGVCQNHLPYDFEAQAKYGNLKSMDLDKMQGNWGPEEAMRYALAAYTPNLSWAVYRQAKYFRKSGGGTSGATPQIAAAAALYIMSHRAELEAKGYYEPGRQWKKVEAVRQALFSSAREALPASTSLAEAEARRYYGNGILKAMQALRKPVVLVTDDMKAPKAESSWFGLSEAVGLFVHRRRAGRPVTPAQQQVFALEIGHVLMSDPQLAELNDQMVFEKQWNEAEIDKVVAAVKASKYCSQTLRDVL